MRPQFYDLSARTKLRVSGADRVRFLNGQTTNDVRRANAASAQESCVLDAKGHLQGHLFLFATEDAIWIDADPEARSTLQARLERYIIADEVEIEDQTGEWGLLHVFSHPALDKAEFCLRSDRVSSEGWDIWIPAAEMSAARSLLAQTLPSMTESSWETWRIENGRPRWGAELTPAILPPEADLDTRAVDYAKGCYIGQEVISRMKMSGQKSKRLCGLLPLNDALLQPDLKLLSTSGETKEAGWITSATRSETFGRQIALGFVKRAFNAPGTVLQAVAPGEAATPISVQVVDLPFTRDKVALR